MNFRYWPEAVTQWVLLRVRLRWTTEAHGKNPDTNTTSYCFIHITDAQGEVMTGSWRPKADISNL